MWEGDSIPKNADLTLIRPGFLVDPKRGEGGLNQPKGFNAVLYSNFSPKFTRNGLKYHLAFSSF